MVQVPVPIGAQMQMGAQQVPQGYYLVPDAAEQHAQQPVPPDPAEAPQNFLESLMPTGWRKRQRPSKRPAARMQKVPSGRKILVASVIHESVTRRSRGFVYVEFVDKIPDGLL